LLWVERASPKISTLQTWVVLHCQADLAQKGQFKVSFLAQAATKWQKVGDLEDGKADAVAKIPHLGPSAAIQHMVEFDQL
jgi:hypothetical protein